MHRKSSLHAAERDGQEQSVDSDGGTRPAWLRLYMLQESTTGHARINVSRRHHTMDTPGRRLSSSPGRALERIDSRHLTTSDHSG